tara:strand:+ start:8698 stop:9423 length:726 start_codon:yes stop_codon:yes gene_type:complete
MAKTQDTYKSLQKTHADVDFGAPAGDLNPTEDKKSLTSVSLNKQIYGVKEALNVLDEEFKHFLPKKGNIKKFFNFYRKNFYILSRDIHTEFITKSTTYAYPMGYKNFRLKEQERLNKDLKDIQREIDELEKEHFFILNRTFIMEDIYSENPASNYSSGGRIFYMQSSKKRQINNYQTFLNLRTKLNKTSIDVDDKDFILFLSNDILKTIPEGPSIDNINDIYISNFEINIYPQTPDEYESL